MTYVVGKTSSDKQNKNEPPLLLIVQLETLWLLLCAQNTISYTNYAALPVAVKNNA
jgi:hypothetical protein